MAMIKAWSKRKSASIKIPSFCLGFVLLGCLAPHRSASEVVPIPELSTWESHMVEYGRKHCQSMVDYDAMTGDQAVQLSGSRLGTTYYDGERVYYQIADYTGDPTWKYCARFAEKFYRDQFAIPANGAVPGYWNFTHGLLVDYLKSGDAQSKDALIQISKYAGYAQDTASLSWTTSSVYARDVSYAVMGYVNAEKVGEPVRARKAQLIDQLLDYIQQWFVRLYVPPGGEPHPDDYLKPFFVGLTMQALIYSHEHSPDQRIPQALTIALDGLWNRAWMPDKETFWYSNGDAGSVPAYTPAPDLNLLIAPAYAWMYLQTGDVKYRDRGDQIFAGGARFSWLVGVKQFNQNYWWAFDYVKWRTAANTKYAGVPAGESTVSSSTSSSTDSTVTTTAPTTTQSTLSTEPTTTTSSTSTSSSSTTTSSTEQPGKRKGLIEKLKDMMQKVR
jgi:hypothetical protein